MFHFSATRSYSILLLGICLLFWHTASAQAPTISSIQHLSAAPGTPITITGTNFNADDPEFNIVYFGGIKAEVTTATAIQLTVTVPKGAVYGPITVTNTATQLTAYSKQYFLPKLNASIAKTTLVPADITRQTTPLETSTGNPLGPWTRPSTLTSGDLDGDGKPDLVVSTTDLGGSPGSPPNNVFSIVRNASSTGTDIGFAPQINITILGTYNRLSNAALADFDGDGKLDIAIAAYGADGSNNLVPGTTKLFVYLNPGTLAGFATATPVGPFDLPDGRTESIAVADMNADGKPDVITANYNAPVNERVSVLLNTGSGSPLDFTGYPINPGGNPLFVYVADMDGDGKPDIVTPDSGGSPSVRVSFNATGAGDPYTQGTTTPITTSVPNSLQEVAIGDLDGDGRLDLAVTCGTVAYVQLFRNTGGLFTYTSSTLTTDFGQQSITLGDMNGDGKPDLIAGLISAGAQTLVFRNTGSSGTISFDASDKLSFPNSNRATSLVAADFNDDGKTDFLAAYANLGYTVLLRNTLQFPPIITSFSPASAAPGTPITITGQNFNTTPANNVVFFGAVKAPAPTAVSTTELTVTVPLGATHDRITVLNTANKLSGSSGVPFSPSFSPNKPLIIAADFAAGSSVAGSTPFSVAYGDFDGDGKADMAVANASPGSVSVFQNTSSAGTIGYTPVPGSLSAGISPRSVAIGDIDGDGKPDLVVADASGGNVFIFRNTSSGVGNFGFSSTSFPRGGNIIAIAVGDIDGDGRPDLAITGEISATGYVYVHRNLGTGPGNVIFDNAFTTLSVGPALGTGLGIVIADINRDGKVELVTSNVGDQVLIFPNTSIPGSISFDAAIARTAAGTGARYVAVGDLNGDEMPDIAVANGNTDNISVFRNTGLSGDAISISSTDAGPFPAGDNPHGIAIGDINGDGKPDIVTANNTADGISILRNASTGIGNISFAAKFDLASGDGARYPALADMDGDGKLDIAVVNQGANNVSIFHNAPVIPDASGIVYVNANAAAPGDGSSWASAYKDLAAVLVAAKTNTDIKEIWVAEGTYKPKYRADNLSNANPTDRNNAFVLVNNVKLYGGFSGDGTETDINQRVLDGSYETILSGDFSGDDHVTGSGSSLNIANNGENAYHVVVSAGPVGAAELNGFTVTGGNANGAGTIFVNTIAINQGSGGGMYHRQSSPRVENAVITGNSANGSGGINNEINSSAVITNVKVINNWGNNYAGGMYNGQSSTAVITRSVFSGNRTNGQAGGILDENSSLVISYSVFSENAAGTDGGGIYIYDPSSLPVITNTVFSGNTAGANGGGIYHDSANGTYTNITLAGNSASSSGGAFYENGASINFRNSIIYGTTSGTYTTANSLVEGSTATTNGNIDATGIAVTDIFADPTDPAGIDGIWGTEDDGLQLKYSATNPVINAGNNIVFDAGQTPDLSAITTDLGGNPRKWFAVDLGAYELSDYGPATQASAISASSLSSTSATLNWTNGDGGKRIVFVSEGSTGAPVPVDGTAYTADAAFGSGSPIGTSGWYCVYNGTGTTVAITGLSAITEYRVMVLEYNETLVSGGEDYIAATATENPVNFTTIQIPQAITFNALSAATYGDADIDPGASTDASGLTISYTSDNPVVATIVSGKIHIISAGTATITASQAGDATYVAAADVPQTLTVSPKTITVTADAQSKTYGDTDPALTYQFSPMLIGSDAFSGVLERAAGEDADTYAINQGTLALSASYTLDYTGANLEITKASLTITANNDIKVYNGSAYSEGNGVSYSSFAGSDDATVLSGTLSYSGNSQGAINTGTYTIVPSGLASPNYNITYNPGTLTISLNNVNVLSFNTQTPGATITHIYGDGIVNAGATASSGLGATYFSSNASVATVNSNGVVSIVGVGSATITANQAGNTNYGAAVPVSFTLTVNPAPLTVTANNASKVYDGTGYSGGNGVSYMGFENGENESVLAGTLNYAGTAQGAVNVGGYFIEPNGLSAANYNISFQSGSLTITKAELTIAADNKSRFQGTPNPQLTLSYTGFVTGEDESLFAVKPAANTTAMNLSLPGTYPITVSAGSTLQNYNTNYTNGILTVVYGANTAPTLAAITNQTFCYTTAEQMVRLSGIGPGIEVNQTVTLRVNTNNPGLFESLTVSQAAGGEAGLHYGIKAGTSGTALVTVTVQDDGGTANNGTDTFSRSFTITVNPLPEITIISDLGTEISKGATSVLTASGGTSYTWANAEGIISGQNTATLTVRPAQNTTYTVTAGNSAGCSQSASFTIEVSADYRTVNATNILTPNGDGVNDTWQIKDIDMYPDNVVKVFDRSGRTVYTRRSYNNNEAWDGILNGMPLTEDTYYYIIDFGNGEKISRGYVTIIRNR